ncbi:MAG TPA: hypothetical protein VNX68_15050, partial [Nitrosopumilaceae archaeon]|nr:hypothetical protein [Nitrosopumilaceae archaeon]
MNFLKHFLISCFIFSSCLFAIGQVNLPKKFELNIKKYDAEFSDTILKNFQVFASKKRVASNLLIYKNKREKCNIAFYVDTCRNHYNLSSEIRNDLHKLFEFAPSDERMKTVNSERLVLNADEVLVYATMSKQNQIKDFTDYPNTLFLCYYNHKTKGKIYQLYNFDGDPLKFTDFLMIASRTCIFHPHVSDIPDIPQLQIQSCSNDRITSISCSKSGEFMAYAGNEGIIKICLGDGRRELRNIVASTKEINKISFSDNEKLIVSCSADSSIKIWEIETGKLIASYFGHTGPVREVSFCDRDTKIISIGVDSTIKLWNVEKKGCYKTIKT